MNIYIYTDMLHKLLAIKPIDIICEIGFKLYIIQSFVKLLVKSMYTDSVTIKVYVNTCIGSLFSI